MVVGGACVVDVVERWGEVVVAEREELHAAMTTTSVRQTAAAQFRRISPVGNAPMLTSGHSPSCFPMSAILATEGSQQQRRTSRSPIPARWSRRG
jgi:hypothetical protein